MQFSLHSQQGFSLLEVLIALIILSVGLLSFAQAEIFALRDTQIAYFQSAAYLQAAEMAERLRTCNKNSPSCIKQEKLVWQNSSKKLLPQIKSKLSVDSAHCKIVMQWNMVLTGKQKLDNHKVVLDTQL
jgi:type IV pilus modification protein PilV